MTCSDKETLEDRITGLGDRIIRCNEKCEGIKRHQESGYYPRAFFLEPANSNIEVAIVGRNPGNCKALEREFYRYIADCNKSDFAAFNDCKRVWKAIASEHPYYQKPRQLLEGLGLNLKGILWSEAVFCENKPDFKIPPRKTFDKCGERFLKEIVKLVPEGKYIVCLGKRAFESVKKFSENKQHKVIGVYHPSGKRSAPLFAKYFEKDIGKKHAEPELRKDIFNEFKKQDNKRKSYFAFLYPKPPFFRVELRREGRTEGKRSTHKLESICTINGCGAKFVVDRSVMKGPLDDPRVVHLREVHKLDTIRLGRRFITRRIRQDKHTLTINERIN